jgi:hypothetical protein
MSSVILLIKQCCNRFQLQLELLDSGLSQKICFPDQCVVASVGRMQDQNTLVATILMQLAAYFCGHCLSVKVCDDIVLQHVK